MAYLQSDVNFGAVALSAATAKTVAGLLAATNVCVKVLEAMVSFDGATSTATPVLVECGTCTFATNGPGTNSTSVTPAKRDTGRGETIQFTAAKAWSTEPTVITVQESKYIGAYNGAYHYIVPFASPIIAIGAKGWVIRCTAPANVNCSGHITAEE